MAADSIVVVVIVGLAYLAMFIGGLIFILSTPEHDVYSDLDDDFS